MNQSHPPSYYALVYTLQKFISGLLMLIVMSFNIILFLEVVLFSGFWEYVFAKKRERETAEKHKDAAIEFSQIQNRETEMETLVDTGMQMV